MLKQCCARNKHPPFCPKLVFLVHGTIFNKVSCKDEQVYHKLYDLGINDSEYFDQFVCYLDLEVCTCLIRETLVLDSRGLGSSSRDLENYKLQFVFEPERFPQKKIHVPKVYI